MMIEKSSNAIEWVAPIYGEAGLCLTMADWQRTGIKTLAYRLSDLLMKPGLDVLNTIGTLRNYVSWSGTLALIIDLENKTAEKKYQLRSRFDGSKMSLDEESLAELVMRLNPDVLLLPFASKEIGESGWVTKVTAKTSISVPACLGWDEVAQGVTYRDENQQIWIESSKPSVDGMSGILYDQEGAFSVLAASMKHNHRLIDERCRCETCKQKLTRAYLHHLLQQTPLLAHRFLIQHNVYWTIRQF